MKSYPFVSILLPVRNEEKYIKSCLQSLLSQDYPLGKIEILIADGLSTDNTRSVINELKLDHSHISLFDNPGRIVPVGLNILIREAKGDVIIRVDGHTTISSDYIRQCVQALGSSGAQNVGGRMNAVGSNLFGKAVAAATSTPFGIGGGRFHFSEKQEWVDTVYLGAWPKTVFEEIGLFDEELVRDQDDEFNYRLRASGGKILLTPKVKSFYTVRSSPKALWKQYFEYGFWKVRVLQKHPRQMSPRQFVPLAFVVALILTFLLSLMFPWGWKALLALLAVYLLANLSASVMAASGQGFKKLILLPLAFAIIHLSYGLGFLGGLFKFWNRWHDKKGRVPPLNWQT
jgi:glycosyltransferase involved in cell wall biosynthesis